MEAPRISLIFLLYNAAPMVPALVKAALGQRHAGFRSQAEWLEVVFMEDASRDDTSAALARALEEAGNPANFRVIRNEKNLGLSKTLNKAFQSIRSPYGLSCHCDCIFGREDYVAEMLELMEHAPDAAAITGQPRVHTDRHIPFPEKVNIVANLMDIFPAQTDQALLPVGFAEGRCDVFRVEALAKVGFYDTTLHASGEDQLLAARLRQAGYEIYQAPRLPYFLSVSDEQNSLGKLLRHMHLFGRTQPYILLSNRKTLAGVTGRTAGGNRSSRMRLRALQLAATLVYALTILLVAASAPVWTWLVPLLAIVVTKVVLFKRHLRAVPMSKRELALFALYQPLMDVYYTAGITQGLWQALFALARGPGAPSIR